MIIKYFEKISLKKPDNSKYKTDTWEQQMSKLKIGCRPQMMINKDFLNNLMVLESKTHALLKYSMLVEI